jgi:hypothetical protein
VFGPLALAEWRKELPMAMSIVGMWKIVSSPDFEDDYLNEEGTPFVRLQEDGDRLVGEYHIALQNGTLDGRPQPDGSVFFSFEGMDEMEEVHGAGVATVQGDRLLFTLMYHQGDDYTFEANRQS